MKSLLDNIYSNIKKDKKNQTEFINFTKKISKELNLNINNLENNNEEQLKELKKELNQYKRKESDTKLKLTFLQSEKNKLEEEKLKLQDDLKKIVQNTPIKENQKNFLIKKTYSSTKKMNSFFNLNINSEIGRLTNIIINDSQKDFNSYEKEKDKKYSFKKKKLGNKTPSLEAETALNFKKIFSRDKNSVSLFEEESNNNNINENENNNDQIEEMKNKVNELIRDKNCLEEKIKNLNENLENNKLKEINLENINSNLIKENIELKQSLILIKENYENEFNLVSNSLINLTEKYQKLKQDLLNISQE